MKHELNPIDAAKTQVGSSAADPALADQAPGEGSVVADIRLGTTLGAGLSSEIFTARALTAGRACVVKMLRPELTINRVGRGRYAHDATQVELLRSSGLVSTYAIEHTARGQTYAVMDFAEGLPLRDMLRQQGTMSRRAYIPLVRDLGTTLAAVHAHGIAHRRLHPGNVIVHRNAGQTLVRILDFGVHHIHPSPQEESSLPRMPQHAAYLAPEIAAGAPGDHQSDIFSVCVMLYQMATGYLPFWGDTFEQTLELVISEEPRPPSQTVALSPDLEQTIMRGLAKDPRKRIPTINALMAELDPLWETTGQHAIVPHRSETHIKASDLGRVADVSRVNDISQPSDMSARVPLSLPAKGHARNRRWMLLAWLAAAVIGFIALMVWLLGGNADDDKPHRSPPARSAAAPSRTRTPHKPAPTGNASRLKTSPTPNRPAQPAGVASARQPGGAMPVASIQPAGLDGGTTDATASDSAPAQGRTARVDFVGRAVRQRLGRLKTVKLAGVSRAGQPTAPRKDKEKATYGTLKVTTGRLKAQVFVDEKKIGSGATTLSKIRTGEHEVHLEVDGQRVATRHIAITRGKTVRVAF